MKNDFLTLVENTITRYSNGGILTGDRVVLRSDYKQHDSYKNLANNQKEYIDSYFNDENNYIVVNIKTEYPSINPGVSDNRGSSFYAEVAREEGSGRYDNQGKVVIDIDLLEPVEDYPNRHPIPDSVRYDNKIQIKPVPVDSEEEESDASQTREIQTNLTHQGKGLKKTERKNATKNTEIPSKPATPSPAVRSYTQMYVPSGG